MLAHPIPDHAGAIKVPGVVGCVADVRIVLGFGVFEKAEQ